MLNTLEQSNASNPADMQATETTSKAAHSARLRKHMAVEVILTFGGCDLWDDPQEFLDLKLPVRADEKSAPLFLHTKLFKRIAQICDALGRDPKQLVKISTASDWDFFAEKTGKPTLIDLGHPCKWWFGAGRIDLDAWEQALVEEYGFGVDVDMRFINAHYNNIAQSG